VRFHCAASTSVKSFDIKWYELQVEFTDHMVTSMEGDLEKTLNLLFIKVKRYAENRFECNGFKTIERKENVCCKEYNRSQRKMIAEF
jgi:hypothetical protein